MDCSPTPSPAARDEYQRRHAARQDESRRCNAQEGIWGNARIVAFLAIGAAIYGVVRLGAPMVAIVLLALAAFAAAIVLHRRVVEALNRARRAIAYYSRALARLDGKWIGVGPTGSTYASSDHPYSGDLNLFGRGSLYQFVCAARTRMGCDELAAWLLTPADRDTILARQAAVGELRDRLELREALAVIEGRLETELEPKALRDWFSLPPLLVDRLRPWTAVALAAAALVALVGWIGFDTGGTWFVFVLLMQAALLRTIRPRIEQLAGHLDTILDELELLAAVLRVLEADQFRCPMLQALHARLESDGHRASPRVASLARLVSTWETIRENKFVAPIAYVLMLRVHLAYAIDRWRRTQGPAVLEWLAACGRFEALASLAGLAYEQPAYVFPVLEDDHFGLEAVGLGHPLIPAARRVTNSLRVGGETQMLLVSGSNMSGKSTLLRTVGVNTVLALAGGPVCASQMRLGLLRVATSMRTVDSLQEGVSRFYAEIQRLQVICRMAADATADKSPVLFLLDEILHGTNSHDRRIGAEAVLENLLRRGAIGLVTTHDLALAEIAGRREPVARNVHFEDQITDERISFDYHLRPGVVPKGNGLALMRMLGFDVEI